MKKLLAAMAMVCVLVGTSFAYEAAVTGTCVQVSNSENLLQCTFTSTNGVTAGAAEVFRLTVPSAFGNIRSSAFVSSSTNCAYHLSESDAEAATSAQTILYVTNINLGSSVELCSPVFYSNKDTAMGDYLYLTITPTTVNTGTWIYTATFDFQGLGLGE